MAALGKLYVSEGTFSKSLTRKELSGIKGL
jgi:hypothetical protein